MVCLDPARLCHVRSPFFCQPLEDRLPFMICQTWFTLPSWSIDRVVCRLVTAPLWLAGARSGGNRAGEEATSRDCGLVHIRRSGEDDAGPQEARTPSALPLRREAPLGPAGQVTRNPGSLRQAVTRLSWPRQVCVHSAQVLSAPQPTGPSSGHSLSNRKLNTLRLQPIAGSAYTILRNGVPILRQCVRPIDLRPFYVPT